MEKTKKVLALNVTATFMCISLTLACSCQVPPSPDRYCNFQILFRGVVIAEDRYPPPPVPVTVPGFPFALTRRVDHFTRIYTVRVDETFVMPEFLRDNATLELRTASDGAVCGVSFSPYVDTLFAARENYKGEIRTGLCDGSTSWDWIPIRDQTLLTSGGLPAYCSQPKPLLSGVLQLQTLPIPVLVQADLKNATGSEE